MPFFDIVVARSENYVIGKNNCIPWHSKKDLALFKKLTCQGPSKNVLILGRHTWESLPIKPLPNRIHFIISTTLSPETIAREYKDVYLYASFEDALDACRAFPLSKVFVIGGGALYETALQSYWCSMVHETIIHTVIDEDPAPDTCVRFPCMDQLPYVKSSTSPTEADNSLSLSFHTNIWKRKKPLVWWIDASCYEHDWITSLVTSIPTEKIIDTSCTQVIPNALIVTNQLISKDTLHSYHKTNTPFSLIHLSDEYLDDDYKSYYYEECKHVFRNYYHPCLSTLSKVQTFGIGPKSHFWKGMSAPQIESIQAGSYKERPYHWSFAGYLKKSDRTLICKLFTLFAPHFVHETQGFHVGILDTETYRTSLTQSKFVLCPIGNCSLDTFRLYEALEAGAIPVTLNSNVNQPFIRHLSNYWEHIFGKHVRLPYVLNDTWEQNVCMVEFLLGNPHIYDQIHHHMNAFWKDYKKKLSETFHTLLWE